MPGNDINIDVKANTGDAEKGIDRVAGKTETAAQKMSRAGRKLTIGVTVPLVAAGAAAFSMASDLDEATSQARQVFGEGADGIIDAAQNMEDSFSETEFLAFASTFGDIAQGMGFAKDEADDLSIGVLDLGQDLASFKNLPTEQAINAITAAMTGEREQLKSLGIVIDEAMVKERALADTGKESAAALTRQEKATATLALITEQSTNAIGDFDRTSDGAANTRNEPHTDRYATARLGEQACASVRVDVADHAESRSDIRRARRGTRAGHVDHIEADNQLRESGWRRGHVGAGDGGRTTRVDRTDRRARSARCRRRRSVGQVQGRRRPARCHRPGT
jgi:hypothetical protein